MQITYTAYYVLYSLTIAIGKIPYPTIFSFSPTEDHSAQDVIPAVKSAHCCCSIIQYMSQQKNSI